MSNERKSFQQFMIQAELEAANVENTLGVACDYATAQQRSQLRRFQAGLADLRGAILEMVQSPEPGATMPVSSH